ncbi:Bax inhibitor-1/YccA family protein [Lactococcus kimchii]|uniref:Bax inhibitor-1/YccA family protein n=1 Tax=Lactococcus sp. S-13 TaxID=2507158 RepID=UPI001023A293|nr:Bax inhibitor-1/YccA family protein [Lactococcus sp. S-13]RZI48942.1 Bax inhibitor-1/YccA family protein [Lactococcus sp. S-13]
MQNMNDNNIIFDQRQDGLNAFFSKIYALMGAGVLVSALVSWIMITFFQDNMMAVLQRGGLFFLILWLIPLVMVGSLQVMAMKNSKLALPVFVGYAAFMGFLISFTLLMYTATNITLAFVTAAAMFFGLAVYGRVTKRNLSGMGKALGIAVWGLVVAIILNFFIGGSGLTLLISIIGVVIFSGLIAWDNQKITHVYNANNGQVSDGWAISMALSLYLDFINMFLFLLRIFGISGGNNRN